MTNPTLDKLHAMDQDAIAELAYRRLTHLMNRATIHLVSQLTAISRPTLYRWLDPERPLSDMNVRDCAWFILMTETSPRVKLLMQRPPMSHPRLAHRLVKEDDDD